MADILKTETPRTIILADGKEYTLPILNMNTLANIENTMGIGGQALVDKLNEQPMNTMRLFAHAILKETMPKITIEEIGNLITLKELKELSDIISLLITG